MQDLNCQVPVPETPQELDRIIQRYKSRDLSGNDLFCTWQAIREASLQQSAAEPDLHPIRGEDSY